MSVHAGGAAGPARPIIVHYHLFKNAGTSVDRLLQAALGAAWRNHEGARGRWAAHLVARWLQDNPDVVALSSHTASLPVPLLPAARIHPIVFVRDPIDRARSVYEFERRQSDATPGSVKAKETDFPGYVRWRLGRRGDRTLSSFQTARLAAGSFATGSELARALDAVAVLPFVGVVEEFDRSVAWLARQIAADVPTFKAKSVMANTSRRRGESLDERLARTRSALGEALADELEALNTADFALHAAAREKLAANA